MAHWDLLYQESNECVFSPSVEHFIDHMNKWGKQFVPDFSSLSFISLYHYWNNWDNKKPQKYQNYHNDWKEQKTKTEFFFRVQYIKSIPSLNTKEMTRMQTSFTLNNVNNLVGESAVSGSSLVHPESSQLAGRPSLSSFVKNQSGRWAESCQRPAEGLDCRTSWNKTMNESTQEFIYHLPTWSDTIKNQRQRGQHSQEPCCSSIWAQNRAKLSLSTDN